MKKNIKIAIPLAMVCSVAACAVSGAQEEAANESNLTNETVNSLRLPGDYEGRTAAAKQAELMKRMNASQVNLQTSPVKDFDFGQITRLLLDANGLRLWAGRVLRETMDGGKGQSADEMPLDHDNKMIHRSGSVAAVELVPAANSPYTGLYQGSVGVVRFSAATVPTDFSFVPGFGLKLLVNGAPSANLVAMYSLEGQGGDWNFFSHEHSNFIPNPPATNIALGLLAGAFKLAAKVTTVVSVAPLGRINSDGSRVAAPVSPCQLVFSPNSAVKSLTAASSREDFRASLSRIPAGTPVYDVYGVDACNNAPGAPRTLVGTLKITSKFVASSYGDNGLFFRHEEFKGR
jgi:hypothetical protein